MDHMTSDAPIAMNDLVQLQKERERSDFEEAKARAARLDARAAKAGKETRLEKMGGSTIEALASSCNALLDRSGLKGPKPIWFDSAELLGPDVLAHTALRSFAIIAYQRGGMGLRQFLKQAGLVLMRAVWTAEDMADEALQSKTKDTVTAPRARRVSKRVNAKVRKAETNHDPDMKDGDLIKRGVVLWDALVLAQLVTTEASNRKARNARGTHETNLNAILTDKGIETQKILLNDPGALALVAPIYRPMICKPQPWRSFFGGGYLTRACHTRLLRKTQRDMRDAVTNAIRAGEMDDCLAAVNALQDVPLRINADALWLRRYVWANNVFIKDVTPNRTPRPVEEVPDMASWPKKARIRFLIKRSAAIRANRAIPSLEAEWERDGREAEALYNMRDLPFYLPHSLDHRGRTYATPTFSHQRGDAVKALFEFHRGVPLGRDGLEGLKVQVANTGDFDKISKGTFEERVAWVDAHMDVLEQVADNPEVFTIWKDADAPFSFYAAVCDLVRAIRSPNPEDYVSHIRVDLDGCNSGVQHYSMIMRAAEGALVGLTPGLPADLYSDIAKRCMSKAIIDATSVKSECPGSTPSEIIASCKEAINEIIEGAKAEDRKPDEGEKAEVERLKKLRDSAAASQWVEFGIERSTVKRPTMTYGYAAEAFGFAEQITTDLMDPLADSVALGLLDAHPFGDDEGRQAAFYLGRSIYAAVQAALPKVAEGMNWLKTVGQIMGKANLPVTYQTPDGFPVFLAEHKQADMQLQVIVRDGSVERVRFKPRVSEVLPELNPLKMKSSLAPNVIHSCDAQHLRSVVLFLLGIGISDIMTIHDSFGVHAAHWRTLHATLREVLVWLYQSWDPFAAIKEQAEKHGVVLPPLPRRGPLKGTETLAAEFAFS